MMSPNSPRPDLPEFEHVLRTTRIIVIALLAGMSGFLGMVLFVFPIQQKRPGDVPILTYMSIIMFCVLFFLSILLPRAIRSRAVREAAAWKSVTDSGARKRPGRIADKDDLSETWLALFQSSVILAGALREGAGLFSIVSYWIEGSNAALVVAGLSLASTALLIPAASYLETWIADRNEELRQAPLQS